MDCGMGVTELTSDLALSELTFQHHFSTRAGSMQLYRADDRGTEAHQQAAHLLLTQPALQEGSDSLASGHKALRRDGLGLCTAWALGRGCDL